VLGAVLWRQRAVVAVTVAYSRTSLRREKRELREEMRAAGLDYRQVAAEFARLYRLRPRSAWREAYGWSLQEAADRINSFRGNVGLDPGGLSGMTAPHLSEYEGWPGYGAKPAGRKPGPYLLAVLAEIYGCQVGDLVDLTDRRHLPKGDLLVLDTYSRPRASGRPGVSAGGDPGGSPAVVVAGGVVPGAAGAGPGAVARRLMDESGVSVRGLARAARYDISTVSKALRGLKPFSEGLARAVDGALDAGGEVIGAARAAAERRAALAGDRAGGGGRVLSVQVPQGTDDVVRALVALAAGWPRGDVVDVDEMERRELLRVLGGLGLAVPLAGGGHAERVRRGVDGALDAPTTAADVAEWEQVVREYAAENGRVAPAALLPELLTDLDEAQARLDGAPAAFRAPMARVLGYLNAITANNLVNAGDARSARRYWRTALRAVGQSGDQASQAMLYATRARFALADAASSPAATLAYADEAVGVAGGVPCGGVAQGHAARALALAHLGDHEGSVAAVRDLADLSARLPLAETAREPFGYSEQSLFFTQSRVYAYAGRAADAVRSQEAGLALVRAGGNAPLPVADFALNTAVVLIQSGDPSEGARQVVRTVEALPAGYRQSALIRQNATRALTAVPAGAAGVPAVVEARELLALPPGAGA
jgi:hypothetical protein